MVWSFLLLLKMLFFYIAITRAVLSPAQKNVKLMANPRSVKHKIMKVRGM